MSNSEKNPEGGGNFRKVFNKTHVEISLRTANRIYASMVEGCIKTLVRKLLLVFWKSNLNYHWRNFEYFPERIFVMW